MSDFQRPEVLRVVSGDAGAWLVGPPVWRAVNGAWRGEVEVWVEDAPAGSWRFWLMLRRNFPSFVLTLRDQPVRRLDVNRPHRGFPGTHVQGRDSSVDREFTVDARDLFPPIPREGKVSGAQYAATFLAFASHVGVGVGSFEWVDAPEGRP